MESNDRDLIQHLLASDSRLKRLYEEHLMLEEKLDDYNGRMFLTADEEMQAKYLKKRKLSGVDQMMMIISGYRSGEESMAM